MKKVTKQIYKDGELVKEIEYPVHPTKPYRDKSGKFAKRPPEFVEIDGITPNHHDKYRTEHDFEVVLTPKWDRPNLVEARKQNEQRRSEYARLCQKEKKLSYHIKQSLIFALTSFKSYLTVRYQEFRAKLSGK